MDQPEDDKPRAILAHMPPHIKTEIGKSLDCLDKISLRNVNRDLRRLIRAPVISVSLIMVYDQNHSENHIKFSGKAPGGQKFLKKQKIYEKNEQGCRVETRCERYEQIQESEVQEGKDPLEVFFQDFESILDIPRLTFHKLHFHFIKWEEVDVGSRILSIISNLESKLKVHEFIIDSDGHENILAILSHLDTNVLINLIINMTSCTVLPPPFMNLLELGRFPNLKELSLANVTCILPLEAWWNVREVNFTMNADCSKTETLAQLPRIIEHLRQSPTFHKFDLFIQYSVSEAKTAIGAIVEWETLGPHEVFRMPTDGRCFGGRLSPRCIDFFWIYNRNGEAPPSDSDDE